MEKEQAQRMMQKFQKVTAAMGLQQKALDTIRQDFRELFTVFIALVRQQGGEVRISPVHLTVPNLLSDYRIDRSVDGDTQELVFKVMHITDPLGGGKKEEE